MKANKQRGEVLLTVGEQQFVLRMTFTHIAKLEDMGMDVLNLRIAGNFGPILKILQVLAGISNDEADELMMEDFGACSDAVMEAYTLFFQRFNNEEKKKGKDE